DSSIMPAAWEAERRAALRSTLARELERLDPVSRELLLRRYVLEQTSGEIARELGWNPPAVRMRLMRIRDQFGSRPGGQNGESSHEGDARAEPVDEHVEHPNEKSRPRYRSSRSR